MFIQPMLLRAELKQYPISYCIVHGDVDAEGAISVYPARLAYPTYLPSTAVDKGFKLTTWSKAIDILTSALVARDNVPEAVIQSLLSDIRATNFKSGWTCPPSVERYVYQTLSARVLLPLRYSSHSTEDQDSMADYLEVCLHAGGLGATMCQLATGPGQRLGEKYKRSIYTAVSDLAKPKSKSVVAAISKIKNPKIIKDINAEHRPALMLGLLGGDDFTRLECSQCCVGDYHKLQRCARCRVRKYCSQECQKAHWIDKHKEECPRFAAVTSYKIPSALAARLDAIQAADKIKP